MTDHQMAPGPALPAPPKARGSYLPAVVHDGLVFSAGMTPRAAGVLVACGVIGADVSIDAGREAAGLAARNALAAVADAAGGLDQIARCLRMTVYIVCTPEFADHSAIADGASEALRAHLGERSALARSAIGVQSLPSGASVEVELTAALRG